MNESEIRSKEEILAVDYITAEELQSLYVTARPLPGEHELDEPECHNCGEPWNEGEDWEERHLHGGPHAGEDWMYTCPGCGFETFEVGI